MAKLSTILDQVDSGTVLLPEFQRGYVWNRDQVRGLMRSLYLGYPVGSLLLWESDTAGTSVRGGDGGAGVRLLLLDGQQRITSLYGVIRGQPPAFFEGNSAAFTGMYFNIEKEAFEFYAPSKMRDDPRWVDVTGLFVDGLGPHLTMLHAYGERAALYLDRINRVLQLRDREFHQDIITGKDKTVDVVVDIFNRVNSGGTELSKGDLALAKLCAEWSEARQAMRGHLHRWKDAGFSFSLDWLLRNVTAVAKGRSAFSFLEDVGAAHFKSSLKATATYVDEFLNILSGRLGIDHDRVLMGRGSMPVMSRLLHLSGGKFTDYAERDKALYWYIHAALWGRHSASTETTLQQDYEAAERGGVDVLIATLERWRGGNLKIQPHDFEGSSRGSRFYPLLYLLTRVNGARDMGSGLELRAEMLGRLTSLQVHHIFPKALLYDADYGRGEVNAIANFCFLTQETNLKVGKRPPQEYFAEAEQRHPGVLASQWIPDDPALWRIDRYRDFLAARRELLAASAQGFLTQLRDGVAPVKTDVLRLVVVDEADDVRTAQVKALVAELTAMGCAEPALDCEVADPVTGRELAVAEAYWPDGLQVGQGRPVVLELDPESADLPRLEELGYEVFTSVDALHGFVIRRNESAAGEKVAEVAPDPVLTGQEPIRTEFEQAMRAVYDRARAEANYPANYFLSMLAEHGGLGTAQRLLRSPAVSDGFATLWERGRLDLTVEALVIQPQFAGLFTETELEAAKRRLEQFGYL